MITLLFSILNFALRHKKNLVKKFDELNDKRKFLSEEFIDNSVRTLKELRIKTERSETFGPIIYGTKEKICLTPQSINSYQKRGSFFLLVERSEVLAILFQCCFFWFFSYVKKRTLNLFTSMILILPRFFHQSFFSFKLVRRLIDETKEVYLLFESNVFLLFPTCLLHSYIKTFQGA
jgi:hypothetical protein